MSDELQLLSELNATARSTDGHLYHNPNSFIQIQGPLFHFDSGTIFDPDASPTIDLAGLPTVDIDRTHVHLADAPSAHDMSTFDYLPPRHIFFLEGDNSFRMLLILFVSLENDWLHSESVGFGGGKHPMDTVATLLMSFEDGLLDTSLAKFRAWLASRSDVRLQGIHQQLMEYVPIGIERKIARRMLLCLVAQVMAGPSMQPQNFALAAEAKPQLNVAPHHLPALHAAQEHKQQQLHVHAACQAAIQGSIQLPYSSNTIFWTGDVRRVVLTLEDSRVTITTSYYDLASESSILSGRGWVKINDGSEDDTPHYRPRSFS
jgi:hypothetical protein